MAALTTSRKYLTRATYGQRIETYKIAANVKIYNGALVGVNAGGYLVPGPGEYLVGVAQSEEDNTGGANGAKRVAVLTCLAVTVENAAAGAAVGQAHYMRQIYALDDQTVTNAVGAIAGMLHLIDEDGVWLFVDSAINAAAFAVLNAA